MIGEVLFKAKRIDNGEWVEGFYVQLPKPSLGAAIITGGDLCAKDVADYIIVNKSKQHSSFSNAYPLEVIECEQYEVDPETICQYTGLTDKAGKKIFEGDIASIPYSKKQGLPAEVRYMTREAMFCIGRIGYAPICLDDADTWCEIIGNVFDNPELLGGAE